VTGIEDDLSPSLVLAVYRKEGRVSVHLSPFSLFGVEQDCETPVYRSMMRGDHETESVPPSLVPPTPSHTIPYHPTPYSPVRQYKASRYICAHLDTTQRLKSRDIPPSARSLCFTSYIEQ